MARIRVEVEGVGATIRAINMFDVKLKQQILILVRNTARNIQKDARARAPVSKTPKTRGKPGDLKRSIRPKYFDGGFSATVVPRKPKGAHRHLVEYGTGSRYTRSGAYRGRMPKMPFMEPAERAADRPYNRELERIVNRDEVV